MPPSSAPRSYGTLRPWLHWTIALLILAMIPTGLIMARTLDDALSLDLYRVHLGIGWLVVALTG